MLLKAFLPVRIMFKLIKLIFDQVNRLCKLTMPSFWMSWINLSYKILENVFRKVSWLQKIYWISCNTLWNYKTVIKLLTSLCLDYDFFTITYILWLFYHNMEGIPSWMNLIFVIYRHNWQSRGYLEALESSLPLAPFISSLARILKTSVKKFWSEFLEELYPDKYGPRQL